MKSFLCVIVVDHPQDCKHMRLNPDTISEIAKGLKMGNLLKLPFDLMFNPDLMAKLLTATTHSFSQIR